MTIKFKCSICGKVSIGIDEHDAETKFQESNCDCLKEAMKLSMPELLEKINAERN